MASPAMEALAAVINDTIGVCAAAHAELAAGPARVEQRIQEELGQVEPLVEQLKSSVEALRAAIPPA